MADFTALRQTMLDCQIKPNKVTDSRIHAALLAVPREVFVPPTLQSVAYADEDLPLGGGRYLIEPMVLARMLQEAAVQPRDAMLVVGAGSGYGTAVAANLADRVTGLECDAGLAEAARQALADLGLANAAIVTGDLAAGYPANGPYDVILVQGRVEWVPPALLDQLADRGRLIAVVGDKAVGVATLYTRAGSAVGHRGLFEAGTPLLPGFAKTPEFVF